MQLSSKVFDRKRSVLYLTSLKTVNAEGSDPRISWASIIQQGQVSLCNATSVSIMRTGLYLISTQVKFRAYIMNKQTMKTTAQFYLGALREGQLSHVDDYTMKNVFHGGNTEHDANVHSITRLETGDKLIIRIPRSQKSYLASELGAHRISIFELS